MNFGVMRCVISVIAPWRRIERKQPYGCSAKVFNVVKLRGQARKVAFAVAVAVAKGSYMCFIDNGVFVPQRIFAVSIHLNALSLARACVELFSSSSSSQARNSLTASWLSS